MIKDCWKILYNPLMRAIDSAFEKKFIPQIHVSLGALREGLNGTRRERLKSALYLRLKKRKTFFGKKLEIFEKKISFGKCRTVPKNVKGGPFLIYKHAFCSKITKNSKGGPFGDIKKNFEKKFHSAEKKSKGGGYETLVPSGLVCNVEKVNECAPRLPLAVQ